MTQRHVKNKDFMVVVCLLWHSLGVKYDDIMAFEELYIERNVCKLTLWKILLLVMKCKNHKQKKS